MDIENMTLSQRIAQAIATRISEGTLKPGDRLLEIEMTESFGTSRAPIREALFILEKDGIVERIPRRGVFVKKHTKKELYDLYEVVYRLLEIALQKVMDTTEESELRRLNSLITEMEKTIQGNKIKKCFHLLEELQLEFFLLSNNDVLKDLYLKMNNQLIPFRYISLSHPSSLERSTKEYREIIKGLFEKDLEKIYYNLKKKEKRALTILENVVDA
jgi:DNA-binding GntR family transcriptional regulator